MISVFSYLEELKSYLTEERARHISFLREFGTYVSLENEKKCWSFIQNRVTLLLSAYPNRLQVIFYYEQSKYVRLNY